MCERALAFVSVAFSSVVKEVGDKKWIDFTQGAFVCSDCQESKKILNPHSLKKTCVSFSMCKLHCVCVCVCVCVVGLVMT